MSKAYYEQSCPRCGKPELHPGSRARNTVSYNPQLNRKSKCVMCGKRLSDLTGSVFEKIEG